MRKVSYPDVVNRLTNEGYILSNRRVMAIAKHIEQGFSKQQTYEWAKKNIDKQWRNAKPGARINYELKEMKKGTVEQRETYQSLINNKDFTNTINRLDEGLPVTPDTLKRFSSMKNYFTVKDKNGQDYIERIQDQYEKHILRWINMSTDEGKKLKKKMRKLIANISYFKDASDILDVFSKFEMFYPGDANDYSQISPDDEAFRTVFGFLGLNFDEYEAKGLILTNL